MSILSKDKIKKYILTHLSMDKRRKYKKNRLSEKDSLFLIFT